MAAAGKTCDIYLSSTATAMTGEACSLYSGKTYRVTSSAKRCLQPSGLVVYDNGVDHTSDVESYNYAFGRFTFSSGYTPTTPITVTGYYYPIYKVSTARSYSINFKSDVLDKSNFGTAYREKMLGIYDIDGTFDVLDFARTNYDTGGGTVTVQSLLSASTVVLAIFNLGDASGVDQLAAWIVLDGMAPKSTYDGLVSTDVKFKLSPSTGKTWCLFADTSMR